MKVQVHSSSGTPLMYNQESSLIMTFLTKARDTGILCSLILILERKAGEQILVSSRLEFLKKLCMYKATPKFT